MKKFEFHLEKLLSYKGQVLDSELMNLAVLNNQLSDAQENLSHLQNERLRCQMELSGQMQQKITPAACQMYTYYGEHLKEQIVVTEKSIQNIKNQVDKQLDIVKKIKTEEKSLETLKTNRFEEYQQENRKAAEVQMEEFLTTSTLLKKAL